MKRIVLIYGAIAGFIVTSMMVGSTYLCYNQEDFKGNMLVGYAGMLLAFAFVFLGIKRYRDTLHDGYISFGKAFQVGALITLVASTMYVGVWLVEYYAFIPDFMDKYTAHVMREAKEAGSTAAELEAKQKEMAQMGEWYKNPLFVVLMTYVEILPLGLVVALISAWVLKKKQPIAE